MFRLWFVQAPERQASFDRSSSFGGNPPSIPPAQLPSESFSNFGVSSHHEEQSGGAVDGPPFPGMSTGGPPHHVAPPGPPSYPSFDSFKHSSAPAMPPPPPFSQQHDPPSAPHMARPPFPGDPSAPSFHNPLGGSSTQRPHHEPPSAPHMERPPYPGDPSTPSFNNPMGANFAQRPQHGYGAPPLPGGDFQRGAPPPASSSSGYPSIPPRSSTPPPVLPSVPLRTPQPAAGGQSYFSGIQMPNPVPGYNPTPDKVTEAQKLGRFAVSALGFDDVQPAIKYLTQALTLLTVPNADIGEIK
jgi:hypothetical protein